ncbi:cytochrome c-type biogenesis protein [Georgenia yuyongxinii]
MVERLRRWWLGALIIALVGVAVAVLVAQGGQEPDRAYALQERLRCPVCKSVSIADSPSETAVSMRRIVDEQVAAGRSDEQIIEYFTQRYGTWVLLDPPRQGQTLLLWILPVLVAAGGVVVLVTRARGSTDEAPDLSDVDRDRVQAALQAYQDSDEEDGP